MPRHPRSLKYANSVSDKLIDLLKVHNASIIIILARKKRPGEIRRMNVCEWMGVCVPSTVAQIQTAYSSVMVVNNYNLYSRFMRASFYFSELAA